MYKAVNPPPSDRSPGKLPSSDSHKPNTDYNDSFLRHKQDNRSAFSPKFGASAAANSYPVHDRPNHLPYASSSHNSSRGYNGGKHSKSFSCQNKGPFMARDSTSYRPNERVWNSGNQRQEGYSDASTAMIRGPREKREGNSSKTSSRPGDGLKRDKYNLEDFPCEYDSAKFYVLKSFSEDDVHKSIKYKVWSSTPKGNEKLDQAFHDAEADAKRTGRKRPIFLFFSVNASYQYVGVAEMVLPVDFHKKLDFWQADRWVGFFPVKWHIIKDVPSRMFSHIILRNNDNSPVTRSRDTQEVELKQGVEMLRIFKSHSEQTSLLDDFNFYDNRERSLKANRRRKSFSHNNGIGRMENQCQGADTSSLVKLTKNLAL